MMSPQLERERIIRFDFPDNISGDEEVDPLITNAMREYDKYTDWFHEAQSKKSSDPDTQIPFEIDDYFDHVWAHGHISEKFLRKGPLNSTLCLWDRFLRISKSYVW